MDLATLIKNTKTIDSVYAYYNLDSGNIWKIGPDDGNESNTKVEISLDLARQIRKKERRLDNYQVVYDRADKRYIVVEKKVVADFLWSNFREVEDNTDQWDLTIIHSLKHKCWILEFNFDDIKKIELAKNINFSITQKNDPHKFIRILHFNEHTKSIPFIFDCEENNEQLSIYTTTHFGFNRKVIND